MKEQVIEAGKCAGLYSVCTYKTYKDRYVTRLYKIIKGGRWEFQCRGVDLTKTFWGCTRKESAISTARELCMLLDNSLGVNNHSSNLVSLEEYPN